MILQESGAVRLGHRNLTLIGMPGAGKSTIGTHLAQVLDAPFVDTDRLIESRWGRTLQEIIDAEGLATFCMKEEETILSLVVSGTVIATGGSVVYSPRAMAHLQKTGWIVWLDLPLSEVERRVKDGVESRGIVKRPGKSLEELYKERRPLYARYAHVVVDVGRRGDQQVVRRILARLC